MNFSTLIKFTSSAKFSPNGFSIAVIKGNDLFIYKTEDLKQRNKFSFGSPLTFIEWSPDSSLIICGIFKGAMIEVRSIDNPNWECSISEGSLGMTFAKWVPDSRKIISGCNFNIKLSIWSLQNKKFAYIDYPKFNDDKCAVFSSNGLYSAVVERKDIHDYIGIYSNTDFDLVSHFMSESADLVDIEWTKDNTSLIIIDYPIESKVYIYSTIGTLESSFEPCNIGSFGIPLMKQSEDKKSVAFVTEQNIKLYDTIVWKNYASISHTEAIKGKNKKYHIFKEEEITEKDSNNMLIKRTRFTCVDSIPQNMLNSNTSKNGKTKGIKKVEWSSNSKIFAYRNDNYPNILWVWSIDTIELHSVIITLKHIKDFKWTPPTQKNNFLFIVTENNKTYQFSSNTISTIEIPNTTGNITPYKIQWNSQGNCLLLNDKSNIIIGYLSDSLF